jgi:hypothetical protein
MSRDDEPDRSPIMRRYARPDHEDFRDLPYKPKGPTPESLPLEKYLALDLPIMDQQDECACTGFGLAAVIHCLERKQHGGADTTLVSPRMIYEMAKRYDKDPGTAYEGSTARGALKGWHKHGVCAWGLWPYRPDDVDRNLTAERRQDAATRPLGEYKRIQNPTDLGQTRNALTRRGVVYAVAYAHPGWRGVTPSGRIPYPNERTSMHAFALVAYDQDGFWLQNSKGIGWGRGGFGYISNRDWQENAHDVWVATLGEPWRPEA